MIWFIYLAFTLTKTDQDKIIVHIIEYFPFKLFGFDY